MKLSALGQHRVVILGLGREGRATFEVLSQSMPASRLALWAETGEPIDGIKAQIAPFDAGLMDFDVAIRSPGIPITHPGLVAFAKSGGQIVNPSSIWFAEKPNVPVIGVTGSKGKSTTTSLLGHLLRSTGQQVAVAGNIGTPLISLLSQPAIDDLDWVVAELSSYQLTDLVGTLAIGLITRLFPEHVDWHGSIDRYYQAKGRLIELASPKAVLVNGQDPELMAAFGDRANVVPVYPRRDAGIAHDGQWIGCEGVPWFDAAQFPLQGQHNLDNAVMALSAMDVLGLDAQHASKALASFQPLPHRLEPIARVGHVIWINDSIATTPHATKAALESLDDRPVVLIVGGKERGADWSVLTELLGKRPLYALVTLPDNGPAIAASLAKAGVLQSSEVVHATDMMDAVTQAQRLALLQKPSDSVVVLSPGAPSFGHYRDFEDRGAQFTNAVNALSQA